MKITGPILCFLFCCQIIHGQTWLPLDMGIGGCLSGHHIHHLNFDSIANKLLVSGTFRTDGTCLTVNGFTMWDGLTFDSVATNLEMAPAYIQIDYNNSIYGSRRFSEILEPGIYMAKLVNQNWEPMMNSPNRHIECALQVQDLLYIGGAFEQCEGTQCYLVASFDGVSFEPLVSNGFVEDGWRVLDLAFYQDQLFAGGKFQLLNQNGESVWNLGVVSEDWMSLFPIPFSSASIVESLQVFENDLYIAGLMTIEGEEAYHSILKWDGSVLSDLSTYNYDDLIGPFNERLTDMEVYDNMLYVAGWFDQLEGQPCQGVARWDGMSWECLNTEIISPLWNAVHDIEIIEDTLYMAGDFVSIGTDTLRCIAKRNLALSGINEYSDIQLHITPNPATHIIAISSSNSIYELKISDITGRSIMNIFPMSVNTTVKIDFFNPGCYLLTANFDSGQCITRKFIVE